MRAPVSVPEVYFLAAGRVAVLELGDLHHAGVQTQRLLEGPHPVWALGVGPETEIYLSRVLRHLMLNIFWPFVICVELCKSFFSIHFYLLNMQLKSHMKFPSSVAGATETRAAVWFRNLTWLSK